MDYKIVSLLAIMITAVLSLPYQPPILVGVDEAAPPCPCGKVYFPLCGSDGKDYNNMCEFNCQMRHVRQLFGIQMTVVKHARCDEDEYE